MFRTALVRTPFQRLRIGGIVLAIVFVVSACGFRYLGEYDWISAIWMVVVTISTVGYAEQSSVSSTLQILEVLVILFGISAAAYTFGGLVQFILEGEIDRLLGVRRMTHELNRLQNHVIVCGYGRMGQRLVADLVGEEIPFVVLERDADIAKEAQASGVVCVFGDATEEASLRTAGIERAQVLVATLPNDAESVFITLTARNIAPALRIIARAEQQNTEMKLRQAGANRVVLPTVVGARQMVRMITRPTTADLMDMVSASNVVDLELDEFEVCSEDRLVGMSVQQTGAHLRHKLLFVAIKQADGELLFNPAGDHQFEAGEILMVTGHREDIQRFRNEYSLKRQ